jgi:hypothetical protein
MVAPLVSGFGQNFDDAGRALLVDTVDNLLHVAEPLQSFLANTNAASIETESY